jgi:hypothetical protein
MLRHFTEDSAALHAESRVAFNVRRYLRSGESWGRLPRFVRLPKLHAVVGEKMSILFTARVT